jgi:hypothetical protein
MHRRPRLRSPPNRLTARIGVYRQAHAHAGATLSTAMASRDPKERADNTGAGHRGANVRAIRPNDFPGQADGYVQTAV